MDRVAVLDFGGQYTHLIANRIRRLGVYSEIKESDKKAEELKDYKGIILSGGPASVYDENSPSYDPKIFDLKTPILGICYGHQVMAKDLGGEVSSGKIKEYGLAEIRIQENKLFDSLSDKEIAWMSHGDEVTELPPGFRTIADTEGCSIAGMASYEKNYFGLQFHPEVTHTENGMVILDNFLKICGVEREWDMKLFLKEIKKDIVKKIGDKKVFLLVSGGVDSSVLFALLEKVLGKERVYGLHIDNGLMRLDESQKIVEELGKAGFDNLHLYDAEEDFLKRLQGVADPEQKRKIIGDAFMEVKSKVLKRLDLNPEDWLIAQGTIYPDTIESGDTEKSSTIKTHHNRTEKVQKLIDSGKIIEPLKELYKDEVRSLGEELGLSDSLVKRHPFPGPGLGIRCLCSNTNTLPSLKDLNSDIKSFLNKKGYNVNPFVGSIKSVGVQGDSRTYKHPCILKGPVDWEKLSSISTLLTNNFLDINRVLLSLTESDLKKQRIKECYLTKKRLDLLREADAIVTDFMKKHNLYDKIWQFPVVLAPLLIDGKESIILRPVDSIDAMTAEFFRIDFNLLEELKKQLMELDIGDVLFDITNKPPGTIEWE